MKDHESWQAYWMRLDNVATGKEYLPMDLPVIHFARNQVGDMTPWQQPAVSRSDGWVNPNFPAFPPNPPPPDPPPPLPTHLGGPGPPEPEPPRRTPAQLNASNRVWVDRPLVDSAHHCWWLCEALGAHAPSPNQLQHPPTEAP